MSSSSSNADEPKNLTARTLISLCEPIGYTMTELSDLEALIHMSGIITQAPAKPLLRAVISSSESKLDHTWMSLWAYQNLHIWERKDGLATECFERAFALFSAMAKKYTAIYVCSEPGPWRRQPNVDEISVLTPVFLHVLNIIYGSAKKLVSPLSAARDPRTKPVPSAHKQPNTMSETELSVAWNKLLDVLDKIPDFCTAVCKNPEKIVPPNFCLTPQPWLWRLIKLNQRNIATEGNKNTSTGSKTLLNVLTRSIFNPHSLGVCLYYIFAQAMIPMGGEVQVEDNPEMANLQGLLIRPDEVLRAIGEQTELICGFAEKLRYAVLEIDQLGKLKDLPEDCAWRYLKIHAVRYDLSMQTISSITFVLNPNSDGSSHKDIQGSVTLALTESARIHMFGLQKLVTEILIKYGLIKQGLKGSDENPVTLHIITEAQARGENAGEKKELPPST